ncbi:MTH1187 family thiamine-binding protein [Clostridioides mangenotii]|uniref:MTH1187 family thiamine-binding protein n=1 Tax=Metaclostridioides mangenotii TaxID=1540 RepID=UPI002149B52F|nr:MTH1187 family thiamine-binding protein [Clostridioides mangenotii]MCR1953659.1 MTH1187 family thiamine-binding protein [Clostridioides mangenotii]
MVIADIAVMPLRPYEGEEEMYKVVDACIELIEKSGLKCEVGAMSTTIEGEFDEVFDVIKKVHKVPFELGCERVITIARVDEKVGGLTIDDKLRNHRKGEE